jgi:general secretion pathway protein G
MAMIGILSAIAVPSYSSYIKKAKISEAVADIETISLEIEIFKAGNPGLPANLATVPGINLLDPWGNPYQYLNIETAKGKGNMRKDRFLVPINSDYDLYSMGEDGLSVPPLTAKSSRDDIIRANDGQFVGLAVQY